MSVWDNREVAWCNCGRCAITVERTLWECPSGPSELDTVLCFWECGSRPDLWQRLKLAFRLVLYGDSPWGVALDDSQRRALIAALNAPPLPAP